MFDGHERMRNGVIVMVAAVAMGFLVASGALSSSLSAPSQGQQVRVVCSMPSAKRTKFVRPRYPDTAV